MVATTSAAVAQPNIHNHDHDPDPVREFWCLLDENENIALSVAAMTVLTGVIRRSSASTVMGMEREIRWVRLVLGLGFCGLTLRFRDTKQDQNHNPTVPPLHP